MTWLFIGVVLIPSFLWMTKRGPFPGGFCALGAAEPARRSWGRQAHEVGPRVLGADPTLPAWMQPSGQPGGERGAASDSHLPGQMQLVLLKAGQGERWWHAQLPAFLHTDAGTMWQGRAQSIWSLTAVAITPFGFNYCGELMNYWLAKHLLDWHFSKEFVNGSRWECSSKRQDHSSQVYPVMNLLSIAPSHLPCQRHLLLLSVRLHPPSFLGAFLEKKRPPPMDMFAGSKCQIALGGVDLFSDVSQVLCFVFQFVDL